MIFTGKKRRECEAALREKEVQLDSLADSLDEREAVIHNKEDLLEEKQAYLSEKERFLAEKEANINAYVREKISLTIQDLAHRDYLTSTSVFQQIRNAPDTGRIISALSQDIKILPPLNITASIKGESGQNYETSLEKCGCKDFKNRKSPCKHMYRLAAEVGALLAEDCINLESSLRTAVDEASKAKEEAKIENAQAKQQLKKAKQKELDVQKIINESTMKFPWLSTLYADYEKIIDEDMENELRSNPHPAPKAADKVRQIRERKETLRLQCQAYKYRLALYESVYPELKAVRKLSPQEAYEQLTRSKNKEVIP